MANIEKAWEYFNCDEETFRLLFDNQEYVVKNLFIKKWGKALDGINVTRELKKSDLNEFNKAIENFKLELIYIDKLKNDGKDNEEIKKIVKNKGIGIVERFMMKYSISKEEVIFAIENLADTMRNCFIYYYGIGRNKMTSEQISKMCNIASYEISDLIKKAEFSISSYLRMKKQSYDIKQNVTKPKAFAKVSLPVESKPSISIKKQYVDKIKKVDTIELMKKPINKEIVSVEPVKEPIVEPVVEIQENPIDDINRITELLNSKQISNFDRLILYLKLKNINDNLIDSIIMQTLNCSLDELVKCYINNLDLFEDKDILINKIIDYDKKYIKLIFNSDYFTNKLSKLSYEEQINIYEDFINPEYSKIKK